MRLPVLFLFVKSSFYVRPLSVSFLHSRCHFASKSLLFLQTCFFSSPALSAAVSIPGILVHHMNFSSIHYAAILFSPPTLFHNNIHFSHARTRNYTCAPLLSHVYIASQVRGGRGILLFIQYHNICFSFRVRAVLVLHLLRRISRSLDHFLLQIGLRGQLEIPTRA